MNTGDNTDLIISGEQINKGGWKKRLVPDSVMCGYIIGTVNASLRNVLERVDLQ